MKVPVEIDLRMASFTLCQFGGGVKFAGRVDMGLAAGRSRRPAIPSQIRERAFFTRGNCN